MEKVGFKYVKCIVLGKELFDVKEVDGKYCWLLFFNVNVDQISFKRCLCEMDRY